MKLKSSLSLLAIGSICLSSCISTEVADSPDVPTIAGNEITLSLSAPEKINTRAGSDHQLRYVAKLFKGYLTGANQNAVFMQRKELLEGDNSNVITFTVDPNETYSIVVFADYIPKTSQKDSNGFYPDCYYDTQSEDEQITMIAFTDGKGNPTDKSPINNDNYDCFSEYTNPFMKYEEKKEIQMELKRAVAKVRFVSTTANPAAFSSLKLNRFDYCYIYNQSGYGAGSVEGFQNSWLSEFSFNEMSNPTENELFYFYTLASRAKTNLKKIEFVTICSDGSSKTTTIDEYNIPFQKNYITTVKGNFLPASITSGDNPGSDTPGNTPTVPTDGDIILYLSTSQEWDTSGLSFTE